MVSFFKELFEYNNHYNQKLIDRLKDHSGKGSEKSNKLMNHIVNAHQIWNSRITNETPFDVWVIHPFEFLKETDQANYLKSLQLLYSRDFESVITYTNSRNETYRNSVKDILFHVINHSTYHRAQIAIDGKANGISPMVSDYIFFKRKK